MVAGSWIRGSIVALSVVVAGGAAGAERVLRPLAPDGCVDDSWEYDDESPGAELRVGTTQRRRLCDEDWAYFSFDSGSRYRVETSHLRGGADTAIELWICNVSGFDGDGGCAWRLASDDNGGVGLGSRIEFVAPRDPRRRAYAAVRVVAASDSYQDCMGYDLTVERLHRTYTVPVVASAVGFGGTEYRSDLRLANPTVGPVDLELVYTPTGPSGPQHRAVRTLRLEGHSHAVIEDVVRSLFEAEGVGTIRINTPGIDLVASSTIGIATATGSAQQQVPVVPGEDALVGDFAVVAPIVSEPQSYTNVGFAEMFGEPASLELRLLDGSDTLVATRSVSVPAFGHLQVNRVLAWLGVEAGSGPYELQVGQPPGSSIVAYASRVDRRSGDAWLTLGFDPFGALAERTQLVPVGAPPATTTDLYLAVRFASSRDLTYLPEEGRGEPVSISVALDGGANVVDDVLALLGVAGPGVVEVRTPYTEVTAYSRRTTGAGPVGDVVRATRDLDAAALYPRQFWERRSYRLLAVGVDGADGHRTGLRWVNPSQEPGRAAVALRTAAGELLGRTVVALTPRRAGRIDDVFAELGVAGRADCSLEVEVVEGSGSVMAWAVVSDQATGDEWVIPARVEERNGPLVLSINQQAGGVELEDLPQVAGFDHLPTGDLSAVATAFGDLGGDDLPVHAVCTFVDTDGEVRAAALGDGDRVDGIAPLSSFWCVVPDWIDCSDNDGGVRITVEGGPQPLTVELDARDDCLLLDTVPETMVDVAPEPAYELHVVDYAPHKLPVLVLYHDAGTGELDATVLRDGDVVAPVAPFQLAALVLDVTHTTSRIGYLSLYPLPRAP